MAYSDGQRAEALIKLWISKFDYEGVSKELGIPERTLRRWDKNVTKKSIPDLLDRAIGRLLMVIPTDMSASQWSTALGILIDKWLLMQGEPTSRTENISLQMDSLDADEYERVIAEAERIIADAKGS